MYDAVREAREQVRAGLAVLAAADPSTWTRTEVAEHAIESHRLQNQVDAVVDVAVAAFDRYGDPQGAKSTPAWMAWKCHTKLSRARGSLARGRALRNMADVAASYQAGRMTAEHVRLFTAAQRSAPEIFAKVEQHLVEDAEQQKFEPFRREIAYFRQAADPDGTAAAAKDTFESRNLHANRSIDDVVFIDGTLDPIGGTVFLNELDRLERELFDHDWAETRAAYGETATADQLERTPEQRRHDALVEMAKRSAAKPEGAREPRVLLTVHIGYETFHGMLSQLADGTIICPTQLLPWLADVDIERVVFDSPSRVLDVGVKQRLFTGATRRAVEARDLFCTHESCDEPYTRCDIDHIQRYEHDGETTQTNGRVRCPHHNPGRRRQQRPEPPDDG